MHCFRKQENLTKSYNVAMCPDAIIIFCLMETSSWKRSDHLETKPSWLLCTELSHPSSVWMAVRPRRWYSGRAGWLRDFRLIPNGPGPFLAGSFFLQLCCTKMSFFERTSSWALHDFLVWHRMGLDLDRFHSFVSSADVTRNKYWIPSELLSLTELPV